jgi:type IV pilus assembly protein PilO
MDKKKVEVIILIVLLFFGLNYGVFSYYIQPQNAELQAAKQNYNNIKNEVRELRFKEQDLQDLKSRVEEMLNNNDTTNQLPEEADNQKLIREFYEACKKYGVQGDILTFSPQGGLPATAGEGTGETASEGDTQNLLGNIKTQLIMFSFSGEKGKVENFIENIRTVSSRKLFISSIDISSLTDTGVSIYNTEDTAVQPVTAQVTLMEFLYSTDNVK